MSDNDDSMTLQVYRSTGEKDELSMSMSQTLADLKKAIASSTKLGTVLAADQRVFYLGRELKSSNRSLGKLLGRQHGVNVIHFMAIPRNSQQQQQQGGAAQQGQARRTHGLPVANEQLDDEDSDDDIVVIENKPVMIDLADDDDEDEEVVQVQPTSKRRRRA